MKPYLFFCSQEDGPISLAKARGKYHPLNSADIHLAGWSGGWNNKTPLPLRYNEFVKYLANNPQLGDTLILCHDDIVITDVNWTTKLETALKKYDVVGLAGGSNAAVQPPCLWHIMCPRDSQSGSVTHADFNNNSTFKTHFGKAGRVLILDGLFLAFKVKTIIDAGIKFDESNPCIAHFYDIDFSLTCNKKKLKLGTTNIDVVHSSPGLRSYNKEWLAGEAWFLNKFKSGEY